MPIDLLPLRMAATSRKFVKKIERQIAKGETVEGGVMQDYKELKDTVKISTNPIKNIFNYFATVKQVKKEIAEIHQSVRTKNPVSKDGYKGFYS